jgi:hypothetical protein
MDGPVKCLMVPCFLPWPSARIDSADWPCKSSTTFGRFVGGGECADAEEWVELEMDRLAGDGWALLVTGVDRMREGALFVCAILDIAESTGRLTVVENIGASSGWLWLRTVSLSFVGEHSSGRTRSWLGGGC